jgi:hypothetical protein
MRRVFLLRLGELLSVSCFTMTMRRKKSFLKPKGDGIFPFVWQFQFQLIRKKNNDFRSLMFSRFYLILHLNEAIYHPIDAFQSCFIPR